MVSRPLPRGELTQESTAAVMAAARVLVALSAASVADVEDRVSLPQLRVLVMAADREDSGHPLSLAAVAHGLGVHPSNATRICDRLVVTGLLGRRDDPDDRRRVHLTLTADGRQLLALIMSRRRASVAAIVGQMSADDQHQLTAALTAFLRAVDHLGITDSLNLA